jgi:hypothetical protein
MTNTSVPNDYAKHFENFSEDELDSFLKSGHHNTSIMFAANAQLHKRRRYEREIKELRDKINSNDAHEATKYTKWAVFIAVITLAVSVKEQIILCYFLLGDNLSLFRASGIWIENIFSGVTDMINLTPNNVSH